jgi:hypothetical protein
LSAGSHAGHGLLDIRDAGDDEGARAWYVLEVEAAVHFTACDSSRFRNEPDRIEIRFFPDLS